jgi:hypothetical protein
MEREMGSNAAIDIGIALILMYLLLSLIVTVINEVIATAADLRSSNLKDSLTDLIDDPVLRSAFYDHGLISGINNATDDAKSLVFRFIAWSYRCITRSKTPSDVSHVSYLSGQIFARAVLDSVDATKSLPTFNDIKSAVEHLPDTNIRDALLAQMATANADLQMLHENVAAWFDNAMDRVSGAYKRLLKQISLFVGLVVVLIVNADTLKITRTLWSDASLRAGLVQAASSLLVAGEQPGANNPSAPSSQTPPTTGTTTPPPPSGTSKVDLDAKLKEAIQKVSDAEQQLRPLPLGWSWSSVPKEFSWALLFIFFAKAVGWGLTTIAISLGAPFWFDLLSLFMRIRGTGEKPQKTSTT